MFVCVEELESRTFKGHVAVNAAGERTVQHPTLGGCCQHNIDCVSALAKRRSKIREKERRRQWWWNMLYGKTLNLLPINAGDAVKLAHRNEYILTAQVLGGKLKEQLEGHSWRLQRHLVFWQQRALKSNWKILTMMIVKLWLIMKAATTKRKSLPKCGILPTGGKIARIANQLLQQNWRN